MLEKGSMMFLTQDELIDLTGYQLPARQRKWLKEKGWVHETARNGRVVVLRAYAESRLSEPEKKQEPVMNLVWTKKAA